MRTARPPKVDAIVVCRSMRADPERKVLDFGGVVRGRLEGEKFPLRLEGLCVYLALTGMRGSYDLRVEIVELATGKILAAARTQNPKRVADPLEVVTECIHLPAVVFDRGRHVCRLLANGAPVHEASFEADWPKPAHAQAEMSPASFARGLARIRAREPGLDDARLAALCGVEPEDLTKMSTNFDGLDPRKAEQILATLCQRFRMRPEEFMEGFA
jgi:hypothetical protein